MADIDNGALSFKSTMDNSQLDSAIQETLRRVQGLTDATVAGGDKMDAAFNATAESIRAAISQIGAACQTHEQRIEELETQYKELGASAAAAMKAGRDEEYRKIMATREAIEGEIKTRKSLLQELRDSSDELEEYAQKQEAATRALQENEQKQVSMRSRIKELKEEMMMLIDQGIDEQSEAYQRLKDELGRLQDIQSDVADQGKILANDQATFQGIISGISGLSGAMSAATGAVALFAGENEDLQRVMTKVQSVMAITIGLQQVSETLNKDSAFSLVTLRGLKDWWAKVVAEATVAETAETVATTANTAAQNANATATAAATTAESANTVAVAAQTTAATAGTAANIGLAGAFRLVGAAIKSIPVFGWILAGISALVAIVGTFVSKAREAKKAQEEFTKAVVEGCYKPIGAIEELSVEYSKLGDNIKDKEKFIKDNQKRFEELGVSIHSVRDAENLLIANKEAFVNAQIAKAKALAITAQTSEKVKKALELEAEIEGMSDTKTKYIPGASGIGQAGTYITVENSEKKEKKEELKALNAEIKKGYENAYNYEKEGLKALNDAGIKGVNEYAAGTIGAIEKTISEKNEALKRLKPNTTEYKKALKEIEDLRKQIAPSTTTPTPTSGDKKDPYLAKLEKYKAEYTRFKKWVNSGDAGVREAAATEFAGLLKEGASYIEYLKKQREEILSIDVASRTKEQNANLRTLNNQIAEETKKTVLEAFNEELSSQLANARSVLDMLNIIEKKRKELKNDDSGLDSEKSEALDKAEKETLKKQKQETDELLEQYKGYLDRRIRLEEDFNKDMTLLQKRRAEATSDAERKSIDAAIENRKTKHTQDMESSGDSSYDELKKQFRTYQDEVTAIQKKYEEQRRVATLHGDKMLLQQLAKAESDELSALAEKQITSSVDWQRLFGNLDNMATSSIESLINKIESQKIQFGSQFNPADLKAINEQLEKARDEVRKRNPFTALGDAFEKLKQTLRTNKLLDSNDPFVQELEAKKAEYEKYEAYLKSGNATLVKGADQAFSELLKNGGSYLDYLRKKKAELQGKIDMHIDIGNSMDVIDAAIARAESGKSAGDALKESLSNTFSTVSGSLNFVKGAFDSVTGSLEKFGVQMDEETQTILNDIGGIMDGASQLSQGIATGNPLSIVQGSMSLLSSAVDLFNSRDRKAQKSIKKHQEEIKRLSNAYKQLEWQINKALGGEVYSNQKAAIRNMKKQQQELRGMISDEKSKKHTDWGNIEDWTEQIAELDRNIQDMLDEISQDILQTTAKDMATELGDALVEAFSKGEDAAESFNDVVDSVLKNAVLNQLKKKFLETQLQGALDQLEKSMGYWNGDNFIFDGLSDYEIDQFRSKVAAISQNFTNALGVYNDLFKDLTDAVDEDDSLTGAVKGVTEETASIVAGQMNAMRMNQVEAAQILRQQLSVLQRIQQNTSYNIHLAKLTRIVELLEKNESSDTLRSQGLS